VYCGLFKCQPEKNYISDMKHSLMKEWAMEKQNMIYFKCQGEEWGVFLANYSLS
jgi:hypothetical protein